MNNTSRNDFSQEVRFQGSPSLDEIVFQVSFQGESEYYFDEYCFTCNLTIREFYFKGVVYVEIITLDDAITGNTFRGIISRRNSLSLKIVLSKRYFLTFDQYKNNYF